MNQYVSKLATFVFFCCFLFLGSFVYSQLDYDYYDSTCPNLTKIVRYGVWSALANDTRMGASLLRLHSHDCFVNGCDGSIFLDDQGTFQGEKSARPNQNSVRGYEVIDAIKATVEKFCPSTVSCTDILTLASRDAVLLAGGPFWPVTLGRRDGVTANLTGANTEIPGPFDTLEIISRKFTAKGLNVQDAVTLSGAHTIGFARCTTFKRRLFDFDGAGNPDPALGSSMLTNLRTVCPNQDSSNFNLAPLDPVTTNKFDNTYYKNLLNSTGLLLSDQALLTDNATAAQVLNYSKNSYLFAKDFAISMMKMSDIGVLTGNSGEIRKNCRLVN